MWSTADWSECGGKDLAVSDLEFLPGSLVQSQHGFGTGEKQVVTRAPRDEFDLWIGLTLVGFKGERKFAVSFEDRLLNVRRSL